MITRTLKLGSLFDGSGGFPLAATHCGIKPVWASEIEPFPILVTSTRFPNMTHLGDVTKIRGDQIEPVDIISFGSPCQDLSIAGKREGMSGSRSGLFFHATRIIQEMRKATHEQYPRFAIWENVPGAFSSHHGNDFHAVLTTLACIAKPQAGANIPRVEHWQQAGLVKGDGYSIAWRVLDAQYFGVPQRRKRIFLIADFASQCAGEILFEPQSLPRNSSPSSQTQHNYSCTSPERLGKSSGRDLDGRIITSPQLFDNHPQDARLTGSLEVAPMMTARYCTGGGNTPLVVRAYGFNSIHPERARTPKWGYETDISKTLDTSGINPLCNQGGIAVVETYAITQCNFTQVLENMAPTLCARDYKTPPAVNTKNLVRKLTPTECARLQGFPDDWTDGLAIREPSEEQIQWWWQVFAHWSQVRGLKKTRTRKQIRAWLADPVTDAALYKMWGNGMALPCAIYILESLVKTLQTKPTIKGVTNDNDD